MKFMDAVELLYEKAKDKKEFLDTTLLLSTNPAICPTVDEFKDFFNFKIIKDREMEVDEK